MFLPLRIVHPYERVPYATYGLMGMQILVFLLTWGHLEDRYASLMLDTEAFRIWQPITGQFLHAGPIHLIGNLIFLGVYGRYVEDRLGPARFLAILFGTAVVGDLVWGALNEGRALGISGGVAGLMGFVLVGAPWVQVRVLFIFFPIFHRFDVAAFWLVGLWLLFELFNAATGMSGADGIAYSAHLGGGTASRRRLRRARGAGRPAPDASEHAVVLRGLDAEASPVAVLKVLVKHAGLTPEDAKACVDTVRAGRVQRVPAPTAEAVARLVEDARALGVDLSPARRGPTGPAPGSRPST